jgi:hypothetical protein
MLLNVCHGTRNLYELFCIFEKYDVVDLQLRHSPKIEQMSIARTKAFDTYFKLLTLGSFFLVVVTLVSFPLVHRGTLSKVLFQLGLSGENNIGSWWSSMLLLLGAIHAFDGFLRSDIPISGRRGWLTLSAILAMLSLDEISSLHEWVASTVGEIWWIPLGLFGATLYAYMIFSLWRSRLKSSDLALITLSFCLFASIVLQEYVQFAVEWESALAYGTRAAIEEGTEVLAMLVLIKVTMSNTICLEQKNPSDIFGVSHSQPGRITRIALILMPILVAASFVLPYPGGPADWLASALFFLGACSVFSTSIRSKSTVNTANFYLVASLVIASMLSNAVKLSYDPNFLGFTFNLRGISLALVLVSVWLSLAKQGRKLDSIPLLAAVLGLIVLSLVTDLQLVWVTVPCLVAIWTYSTVLQSKQHNYEPAESQRSSRGPQPS